MALFLLLLCRTLSCTLLDIVWIVLATLVNCIEIVGWVNGNIFVLDLPEWSTVGVDDIGSFGTFDASGAFMSKDVRLAYCYYYNYYNYCNLYYETTAVFT